MDRIQQINKPILLAYHDVSWQNLGLVYREIQQLQSWGFPTPTLGVIPHTPISAISEMQSWITQQHKAGAEFLLHGYKHLQDSAIPRLWHGKLQGRITNLEAEFAGLNYAQSEFLLQQALHASQQIKLPALGFVAPTWHAPHHLQHLCWQAGLSIYESRFSLSTPHSKIHSIPWSIAGIPAWLGKLTRQSTYWALRKSWTRMVFHPGEIESQLWDFLPQLLEPQRIACYSQLLSTQENSDRR